MENISNQVILILAGVTIAVLLQAGILFGIFLAMRKAVQMAKEEADEYRNKLTPLIESGSQLILTAHELIASTKTLINNLKPHVESTAAEIKNMTHDVHAQVSRLQAQVDDISQKARHHTDRVDGMTTSFLNGVDRFGVFLNEAVHVPLRQVNGVVAAVRAVVDTLRTPAPKREPQQQATHRPRQVDEARVFSSER